MSEEKNLIGKEILTYRIESLIGSGGMGSVYLAANKHISQKVAIKMIHANLAESPVVRQKFKKEAITLQALDHPNIVHFLNYVENEDGVFLIMEYVDGITLDDFINTKHGLIVETKAYELFSQILDAFAYAHKRGIVHRDIKPANIILTNDSEGNMVVKVLDFGIARIISESTEEEEKGMAIGTLLYMSPEQVRGEEVDARSDIYSLGVLLHQMLTGHAPYDSTTLSEIEILKKVVEDPLSRMKEYYQYVSDRLQRVVDKATSKDSAARYPNCASFRKDFLPKPPMPLWQKIAAVVIPVLLLGGSWLFYDYNCVTKTFYCKDYVEQWGVPTGIGKLSRSEFENRIESYRFKKLKGKIIRVSHVNNKGNIVEHHDSEHMDRYDDMLLSYRENGIINDVKRLDRNGKVLYIMRYSEDLKTATFTHDDDAQTEITLSANTTKLFSDAFGTSALSANEKSNISKYLLTYDDSGYLKQLRYAGFRTSQICDAEGIYGKEFVVDKKGRVIELRYLGKDYTPKANRAGLAIRKLVYDDSDDFVEVSYFAADGEPGFDGNGCHVCVIENDKYGNRIKETYYDIAGNISVRTDCKIAGFDYTVENGFMIQQTAFDVDGKACYMAEDEMNMSMFGFASSKREYDANGYMNKNTFLDTEGKPAIMSMGIAVIKYENDPKGNALKHDFFDTENKRCESVYGYSKMIVEYDSVGNTTFVSYLDTEDAPCMEISGVAGFRCEYDTNNRLIKQIYFDTDQKPCESMNGVIIVTHTYGKDNNLRKITFFAADGKTLKLSHESIAGWESEYKDGCEIERAFFDTNGSPAAGNIGYARWTAKYDENGFLKEKAYFDKNGSPTAFYDSQYGFSYTKIEYVYDEKYGNKIEDILYSGAVKKQIIRYAHDDKTGDCTVVSYFDGNGNAIINTRGWHKAEYDYNSRKQMEEARFYNTKGNITIDTHEKYAIHRNEYDNMGRLKRQTYFDENRQTTKPSIMVPEALTGYDKRGFLCYLAAADGYGNLIYNPDTDCAYQEFTYDVRGHRTEERFYNTDKKLRQNNYAIARYKYDKAGRELELALYDYSDKAADFNYYDSPCHKLILEYDEQGNLLYQKRYKTDGSLVSTFKFNTRTNDWDYVSDWRQYWRSAPTCPFQIDDGVEIASISLIGNGCEITVSFTGLSKYSMEDAELEVCKDFGQGFAQFYKEESQMPANTQLTVTGVDMAKRELFRVTY